MVKPTVWDVEPEKTDDDCPKPGIYEGIPFEEYCGWNAINQSRLKRMDKSPQHYLEPFDEKSKAFEFGHLIHTAMLEPMQLPIRYAVMPAYQLDEANVKKDGKRSRSTSTDYFKSKRDEFHAANEGKVVVTNAEYKEADLTTRAIAANARAMEYLSTGRSELSIIWHDPSTGFRCKARIDREGMTDLKTTRDAEPYSFEWSIHKYGYDKQAAWYTDGWKVLTGEDVPFRIIAVSKDKPIQCVAAPVSKAAIRIGRDANKILMARVAECRESGEWPGYENPHEWNLPEQVMPSEVII